MRLGFYYHVPAAMRNGKIVAPGYLGVFIDALAQYCTSLVCFLHQPEGEEEKLLDYTILSKNVRLVSLPKRGSVPSRMVFDNRFTAPLRQWKNQIDAMLIRGPSPLLPAMASAAEPVPVSLLLVGDYLAGVDTLPQPVWRKDLIRLWSRWYAGLQLRVAKQSLTFVNSQKLFDDLKPFVSNIRKTRTTTLSERDFTIRQDTCQKSPIRLLYTGRIDPAKGLFEMVEALALLVEKGVDAVLDLVGWENAKYPVMEELFRFASQLEVGERVKFYGYQPLGPALFAFYQQADIYVLASKSSEGFPRTIWEAMANSLPVVATKVGSIPDYITGYAQLVEPNDVQSLVDGILRLINNSDIRREYIQKGRELAKGMTLEAHVPQMVKEIKSWVDSTK